MPRPLPAFASLPAPAPERPRRRKDARPQELLDGALALFIEHGFAATRTEAVAARAGVSKGTLFLYYPTKDDLFKAVIRHALAMPLEEGRALVQGHDGPTDDLLRHALLFWWNATGAGPAGGICKLMVAEARNFPDLATFFEEEVVRPGHALLEAVIERGIARGEFRAVDATVTAQVIVAPITFLTIHAHSIGACPCTRHLDAEAFMTQHLDLVLHGLRRAPA